jgi:photosystem II stability/assembly factor-like uncharacterized protein
MRTGTILLAALLLGPLVPGAQAETAATWVMTFPHETSATERVRATADGAAWAVIDHSRIMRSTDAGVTWAPVNPMPVTGLPTDGLPLTGPRAAGSSEFYVAASSARSALAANGDAVSGTDDGGLTWRPVRIPPVTRNGAGFVQYAQRSGGRYWLGMDGFDVVGGCAKRWRTTPLLSSPDGRTWTRSDLALSNGTVLALDFLDARHGAVSVIDYAWHDVNNGSSCGFSGESSSSVVFVTDDGGRHWRRALRCVRACYGLAWSGSGRLVLGAWDGVVLESRNYGRSFARRAQLPVISGVLGLQSLDCSARRCWALVNGTGVYRQSGAGEWVHEVSDADAPGLCLVEIAAVDDARVVAAGPHGLMARYPVGGQATPWSASRQRAPAPSPVRTAGVALAR